METLTFQTAPTVTFATNRFTNVPIIFQYDDTPMISVVKDETLNYTTEIPIFYSDGTYMAKVKGTRIYKTKEGEKVGLEMSYPKGMTVCKMGNKTVFEIYHESGDAFRTHAELHTPNGYFVKSLNTFPKVLTKSGKPFVLGGLHIENSSVSNCRIGIWIKSNGSFIFGVS
jgi:hypothetical protein